MVRFNTIKIILTGLACVILIIIIYVTGIYSYVPLGNKKLWLDGTNKITISFKDREPSTFSDKKTINQFKKYLTKCPVRYINGMSRMRFFKITLYRNSKKYIYGYSGGNFLMNFDSSPGTTTWVLKVYMLDPSFDNYLKKLLKYYL